jgi:hypothetical protein
MGSIRRRSPSGERGRPFAISQRGRTSRSRRSCQSRKGPSSSPSEGIRLSPLDVRPRGAALPHAAGRYGDTQTRRRSKPRALSSLTLIAFPGLDLSDQFALTAPRPPSSPAHQRKRLPIRRAPALILDSLRTTVMAPMIRSRRMSRCPIFEVRPSRAFPPPMATFRRGRDFAAWLGLVPRQHTTGAKASIAAAVTGPILGMV